MQGFVDWQRGQLCMAACVARLEAPSRGTQAEGVEQVSIACSPASMHLQLKSRFLLLPPSTTTLHPIPHRCICLAVASHVALDAQKTSTEWPQLTVSCTGPVDNDFLRKENRHPHILKHSIALTTASKPPSNLTQLGDAVAPAHGSSLSKMNAQKVCVGAV